MPSRSLVSKPVAGAALNRAHPICRGLISAWVCNEGSGSGIHDLVSQKRSAAINISWEGTARGSMMRLRGTGNNSYAELADLPEVNGLTQLTLSVWMRRMGGSNFDGIITRCTNTSLGFDLDVAGTLGGVDDLFWRVSPTSGGPDYGYTTGNFIAVGVWYHVVAIFDGTGGSNATRGKLYINGDQKTLTFAGTWPTALPTIARPLRIGRVEYSSGAQINDFNGNLDLPMIWGRALTEPEIERLYLHPWHMLLDQGERLATLSSLPAAPAGGNPGGIINNPIPM